ncbi:hypothetical protein LUZ60_012777 [Juncus effusus]|nr:hypothetical protein LUZ60_012777 [Juncus effusus]
MIKRVQRENGYVEDTRFVLHEVREEKVRILHCERLAIAFVFIGTKSDNVLRVSKNLRVCGDCHEFTKMVSKVYEREVVVRDANRFYHFKDGSCSCRFLVNKCML